MSRNILLVLLIAILAAGSGFFIAMMIGTTGSGAETSTTSMSLSESPRAEDLVGKRRPDFKQNDTSGAIVSSDDFDGNILLVNFWATWCQPCVEEMPMLAELQQHRAGDGLQVIGIALDDADRAAQFASGLGIDYPVLVGQTDVVLTGRRYGNSSGMLPFSVLVDRTGIVRWTRLGALDKLELERQISLIK